MTIPTGPEPRRRPSHPELGAEHRVSIERGRDTAHQARRFLEHARIDARRANIVIQLAEAVGDRIDSLSGYIDMLLASEHDKYVGWLAELGVLERSL